jgi:DNA-binding GntR family transcriptional regulator
MQLRLEEHPNLVDRVYDAVENAILNGSIKLGERIVEIEIASKLGVSKSPVREALKRLEAYDIIELLPRKGFVVKKIDRKRVTDLFEVLLAIEQMTAKLVVKNNNKEMINEFRDILDKMEHCAKRNDSESFMSLNEIFHGKFHELTTNEWIMKISDMLRRQTKMLRSLCLYSRNSFADSIKEHKAMVKAYRRGDQELLTKLSCQHQTRVRDDILRSDLFSVGERIQEF